jgi:hypothetical protein
MESFRKLSSFSQKSAGQNAAAGRVKELALVFFPYRVVFLSWCGLVKNFGSVLQAQFNEHPRGGVGDPEAGEGGAEVK